VRELAAQFLTLAEKQGAPVPLVVGHRVMGVPGKVAIRLRARVICSAASASADRSSDRWPALPHRLRPSRGQTSLGAMTRQQFRLGFSDFGDE
jgi:hypothetical protein